MHARSRVRTLASTAVWVFVLAWLGLYASNDHPIISTVWPAAGFSLAVLLTRGFGVVPAIVLATWAAAWASGAPWHAAVVLSAANIVGPSLAVLGLRRFGFDRRLLSLRDGALLIAFGGAIAPALSATIGVLGLGGGSGSFDERWATWWTGNALGVLAFSPWFMQFDGEPTRLQRAFSAEALANALLMALVTVVVVQFSPRLSWLLFPIVGWQAIRYGTVGAAATIAVAAIVGTALGGWGAAGDAGTLQRSLEFNQSVLLGLSASALLFATFWQQHVRTKERQQRVDRLRVVAEELSGAGSWEWETHTGRLRWSSGLQKLYGVPEGGFGGRVDDYLSRLHPDDLALVSSRIDEALTRGVDFRGEERIVRDSDGEVRVLESFGRIVRDGSGGTTIVGACLDITERRREELQRRTTLNHLQALIDASPLAILEMDAESKIRAWNPRAEQLFEWRAEEIIGLANPLVPSSERPAFENALARVFRGESVVIGAQRRVTKSGNLLLARVSLAPVKNADGSVGSVVAMLEDVTARERLEAALRHSESELMDLFHSAPVGIYRKTPQGELLTANQALASLLGYASADELLSRRQRYTLYDEPAERERLLAGFAAGADALGAVMKLRRRDGSSVRVQWDARAVRAADGGVRYLECFVRDITDRLNAERGLRENRDQLALLSRRVITAQETERQSIARGLHDEVGQTLTAIQLSLHALRSRLDLTPPPPELDDALATLELASRSVLDLALDLRPSVLDDIGLEAALKWYLHRSGQRASLHVHMSSTLGTIRVDPSVEVCCYRIAQEAVTNVVRHANATHVNMELTRTLTTLLLRVRDDGEGFNVEAVSAGPYAGRLGLIGMQERAALVGGHIDVVSSNGETILTARLPLHASIPAARDTSGGAAL